MTDDVYLSKKGGVTGRLPQVSFVNFQLFRKCAQPEHSASLQPGAEAGLQTAGHLTPGDDDDFISERIKIKLRSGTWSSSSSPSSSTRCHTGTTPTIRSKSRIDSIFSDNCETRLWFFSEENGAEKFKAEGSAKHV